MASFDCGFQKWPVGLMASGCRAYWPHLSPLWYRGWEAETHVRDMFVYKFAGTNITMIEELSPWFTSPTSPLFTACSHEITEDTHLCFHLFPSQHLGTQTVLLSERVIYSILSTQPGLFCIGENICRLCFFFVKPDFKFASQAPNFMWPITSICHKPPSLPLPRLQ